MRSSTSSSRPPRASSARAVPRSERRGRLNPPAAAFPVDTHALPVGQLLAVQPGETRTFQVWYRDADPAPTSVLTDAVSVTFR